MTTAFTIEPSDDKKRLDRVLLAKFPDVSRAFLQSLCKSDQVLVNKKPQKSGYKLRWGDTVEILFDMESIGEIPAIDLPILYEDDDVLVIDKPAGVLSHGLSKFKNEPSVASFLRQRVSANPELNDIRYGIVHRLDRQTSGCMVCAKTPAVMKFLQEQFAEREVEKTYVALSEGRPKHDSAVIDIPIERNPNKPATFRVGVNGKSSKTEYSVLESKNNYSLISLRPKTGRTHQLRVHLSYIDCPIVGDVLYSKNKAERMMLHAQSITLKLPSGSRKKFTSVVPPIFYDYLEGRSK